MYCVMCLWCVCRSPDGSSVLCNSGDNCLRVFDVSDCLNSRHLSLLSCMVRTVLLLIYLVCQLLRMIVIVCFSY